MKERWHFCKIEAALFCIFVAAIFIGLNTLTAYICGIDNPVVCAVMWWEGLP